MENNINLSNENNGTDNPFLIKTIYGIIGGIQSILHIISGFCDAFYLLKEFKVFILENIFKAIKYSVIFLKYILTFKFIGNKAIRLITNIIITFGISLCLMLLMIIKKDKENNLNKQDKESKAQINLFYNSID